MKTNRKKIECLIERLNVARLPWRRHMTIPQGKTRARATSSTQPKWKRAASRNVYFDLASARLPTTNARNKWRTIRRAAPPCLRIADLFVGPTHRAALTFHEGCVGASAAISQLGWPAQIVTFRSRSYALTWKLSDLCRTTTLKTGSKFKAKSEVVPPAR